MELDSGLNQGRTPSQTVGNQNYDTDIITLNDHISLRAIDVLGAEATIDAFRDWVVDIVGNGGDKSLMAWLEFLKDDDSIRESFGGIKGAVWLLNSALSYQKKLFKSSSFVERARQNRQSAMQWYRDSSEKYLSTLSKRIEIANEEVRDELLKKLKDRFDVHYGFNFMHFDLATNVTSLKWENVLRALNAEPALLWSLLQMEKNGHEPMLIDMVGKEYIFGTGSLETPKSTRNTVYDKKAEEEYCAVSRGRRQPPNGNAMDKAKEMGAHVMCRTVYSRFQRNMLYDHDGNCWVSTYNSEIQILHENIDGQTLALRQVMKGGVDLYGLYLAHINAAWCPMSHTGFRCYIVIEEVPLEN